MLIISYGKRDYKKNRTLVLSICFISFPANYYYVFNG